MKSGCIVNITIDSHKGQRHYYTNDNIAPHRKTNTLKLKIVSNIMMFHTKTTTSLTLRKKVKHALVSNRTNNHINMNSHSNTSRNINQVSNVNQQQKVQQQIDQHQSSQIRTSIYNNAVQCKIHIYEKVCNVCTIHKIHSNKISESDILILDHSVIFKNNIIQEDVLMQSRIQELYCLMTSTRDLDKILTIKSLTKNCSQGKKSHQQYHSFTSMSHNYRNGKERLYQLKEITTLCKKTMQQSLQNNKSKHTTEKKGNDSNSLSTLRNSFTSSQSCWNSWCIPRDELKLIISPTQKLDTHDNEIKVYYKPFSTSGKGIHCPENISTSFHQPCPSYCNRHTFSQLSNSKPNICNTSHRFNFPLNPTITYSPKLLTSTHRKRFGNTCEATIDISADDTLPSTADKGRTNIQYSLKRQLHSPFSCPNHDDLKEESTVHSQFSCPRPYDLKEESNTRTLRILSNMNSFLFRLITTRLPY